MVKIFGILGFILAMWSNIAVSATYYVDDSIGNDSNTGAQAQNISTPWKTIGKATSSISAGDTILVRGGLYRISALITFAASGTVSQRVTLKNYNNEEVIVDGSSVKTGFTLTSGVTYEISDTSAITGVWENSRTAYSAQTSIVTVEANTGSFWKDGVANKLYIHTTTGAAPSNFTIEAGDTTPYVDLSVNYITIDGLKFKHFVKNYVLAVFNNGNNIIIKNCVFYDFGFGQTLIELQSGANNFTIQSCIFNNIAGPMAPIRDLVAGGSNLIVRNCIFYNSATCVFSQPNITVKNNIFYMISGYAFTSAVNQTYDYNCYRSKPSDNMVLYYIDTYYYDSTYSSYKSLSGYDSHSILADPKFVSTTSGSEDFHLQSDSPLIGKGENGEDIGLYNQYAPPKSLNATNKSTSTGIYSVELNWTAPTKTDVDYPIAEYQIYRRTKTGSYTSPINKSLVTTTSYIDNKENSISALTPGTYYYKVKAVDTSGVSIDSNEVSIEITSKIIVPKGKSAEVIASDDPLVKLIIPENTINKDLEFTIESKPGLPEAKDTPKKATRGYEFKAVESGTTKEVNVLEKAIELQLHTTHSGSIVIGTEPEISLSEAKDKLAIGYWNGIRWIPMQSKVEITGNDIIIKGNISHLSIYAIVVKTWGKAIPLRVEPNPVTPRSNNPLLNQVTFTFENSDNENVELSIWDITGRLVRRISMYGVNSIIWDCRDENGEYVEGGVYVYQLKVGNSNAGRGTIVVAY